MSSIEFLPLQPSIGAEVRGIDLTSPLEEDTITEIRSGLVKYKVIFFRDQMIDRDAHLRFSRYFGELDINPSPTARMKGFPEIFPLNSSGPNLYNETIHSDVSYLASPPFGAILRAITVPSLGGDTIFVNAVSAYDGLSDDVKKIISGLSAVHVGTFGRVIDDPQKVSELHKRYPPQEHPVVRIHPDTGERILFVNEGYTTKIVGPDESEGRELLKLLFDQFKRPEHQIRFNWKEGSLAFWDNRATQHCLVPGYIGRRYLERVTLKGDAVIGVVHH